MTFSPKGDSPNARSEQGRFIRRTTLGRADAFGLVMLGLFIALAVTVVVGILVVVIISVPWLAIIPLGFGLVYAALLWTPFGDWIDRTVGF